MSSPQHPLPTAQAFDVAHAEVADLLATTGIDSGPFVIVGVVAAALLIAGTVLVLARRRRANDDAELDQAADPLDERSGPSA